MLTIKKGDMVKVMAGRDQGKTGRVISVNHPGNRVLIEHVQMIKRHMRANPSRNVKGGILERESPIHRSNVMLLCPTCGPIRPRVQQLPDGKKVRACRKCANTLD